MPRSRQWWANGGNRGIAVCPRYWRIQWKVEGLPGTSMHPATGGILRINDLMNYGCGAR